MILEHRLILLASPRQIGVLDWRPGRMHWLGEFSASTVGGYEDHVHLLVGLSRTITIAQLVENVKTETSKWAKQTLGGSASFSWQAGYGAFSVSHSMRDVVDQYIRTQAEHHRKMTFQEEFHQLCVKHDIEIDERYVWD